MNGDSVGTSDPPKRVRNLEYFYNPLGSLGTQGSSMTGTHTFDRRRFVKALGAVGAVGALAGCNGDGGDGSDGADGDGEPTDTETDEPTETETETEADTETDGGDGSTGGGSLEETVSSVNETIDELNNKEDQSLTTLNSRLNNVDGVEMIEEVSASNAEEAQSEAERLRNEIDRIKTGIVDRVPREINAQAGFELVDPSAFETIDDLEQGAEDVPNDRAATAMREAAALGNLIEQELTSAADQLESAGG